MPSRSERRASAGDMLGQTGRPVSGQRWADAQMARAEAARAAREAGYKSPLRRLLERLLPRRRDRGS